MNKKDLFNGLNRIDDELINEAMEPCAFNGVADSSEDVEAGREKVVDIKKKRNRKIIKLASGFVAAAAVITIAVLVGDMAHKNKITKNAHIGREYDINSIGDVYVTSSSYGGIYEKLESLEGKEIIDDYMLNYLGSSLEKTDEAVVEDDAAGKGNASNGQSASDYSKTNVMTEGVDESDIVKTDGNYIYMVESSEITITDISGGEPGDKKTFTPDFDLPSDQIMEMYVSDEKMLLIVSHIKKHVTDNYVDGDSYFWTGGVDEETVCYSYDISEPMKPVLIGTMRQDGGYSTSRKVGSIVYLFSNYSINKPDMDEEDAVKDDNLNKWIPQVNGTPLECDSIYLAERGQYGTMITSFDVNAPDKSIDAKYVMNGYGEVYVSNNAIYFYDIFTSGRNITQICKVSYDKGIMKAGNATSVRGEILDSFAISQQKDNLIVLTTEYDSRKDTETNTLYVLNSDMEETGVINDIAKGERVYAARFVGDLAYFITFKQVDPLFVADISDPANPKLLGELEVEGFSEYLHMWDENHVLGIGYMTEGMARSGVKITMFDVTDPVNPVEENYMIIEDDAYSSALYGNYKAILADPDKKLIGFAAEHCPDNVYDDYCYEINSVYHLLTYDSEKGFTLLKDTEMGSEDTGLYRGLYSGDNFYVAGNGEIKYFPLSEKSE